MSASEKLLSLLLLLLLVKDASVEGLTSLSILCKDADMMLGGATSHAGQCQYTLHNAAADGQCI
jgi:hypothetical protein